MYCSKICGQARVSVGAQSSVNKVRDTTRWCTSYGPSRRVGIPSGHAVQALPFCHTFSSRQFPWVSVRKCRDTVESVDENTCTTDATYGTRTLIHTHPRFRRSQTISMVAYAYAIFRLSGCVGTPCRLETVWRGWQISAILLNPQAACQSGSQCARSLTDQGSNLANTWKICLIPEF